MTGPDRRRYPLPPDSVAQAPAVSAPRLGRSALALATLLAFPAVLAAGGPRFSLTSDTVDGGGSHSQGARFALEGTVGQPDTGLAVGQRFAVEGGFWTGANALPLQDSIFQDSFED